MKTLRLISRTALVAVLMFCLLAAAVLPAGAADIAAPVQVLVLGDTGSPVAGARLELFATGEGLVSQTTTAVDGRATLYPPGANVYWLRVWADGFNVVERPLVRTADRHSLTVNLEPRQGRLSGQVVDHLGLPVAGAVVTAWRPDRGAAGRAQTGAEGTFVLRNLQAGRHVVQVEATGFQPQSVSVEVLAGRNNRADITLSPAQGTVSGSVVDAGSGRAVTGARVELVRDGWGVVATALSRAEGRFTMAAPPAADAAYRLRLSAADYAVTETAAFDLPAGGWQDFSGERRIALAPLYGAVWGYVLRADERPLTDARVELQLQGVGTVAAAQVDEDGFFALDRVRPGAYRVRAFPGRDWSASDTAWFDVDAGQQYALRIQPVNYTKRGYGEGMVAGFVSDGGSHPIEGATVTLLRGHEVVATTETDRWGRYRFNKVAGNVGAEYGFTVRVSGYILRVEAPGYITSDQPVGNNAGEIDVQATELTEVNFDLQASRIRIGGLVRAEQQQPLAGVAVSLFREGQAEPLRQLVTDAAGRFSFSGLTTDGGERYFVTAAAEGYLPVAPTPPFAAAAAAGGAIEVNLDLQPVAMRLQGSVTDVRGEPVAAAVVTVLRPADGRTWEVAVRESGWYSIDDLPAGPGERYLVRAAAPGAPAATAETVLAAGGRRAATVHLVLAPAACLSGVVADPSGQPVPGAIVQLWQEGRATQVARSTTDGQGRYTFEGLAAGARYTVLAAADGYRASALSPGELALTRLVTAAAGQTARHDVILYPQP